MSTILGINAYHPGASAALIVDGVPVSAIPEERLNRKKYYAGFPRRAIEYCLETAGLRFKDLDHVAIGRSPQANRTRKILYASRNPKKLLNLLKIKNSRNALNHVKQIIGAECQVDIKHLKFDVRYVEHHLAHIASAYFISPWDQCAGISIDGSGDFVSCMFAKCEGPDIHVIRRIFVPNSLGTLYSTICEFIGYGQYGDEGKVMGLAPLGDDNYSQLLKEMVSIHSRGFTLNSEYILPFGSDDGMNINLDGSVELSRHYSDKLVRLLGPSRVVGDEITKRDKDLARSLQHRFEEVYLHLLQLLHVRTGQDRVAMAGGCTLNSVANGLISDRTGFSHSCIQPAAGDDGLALGAALYVSNKLLTEGQRWEMTGSYLGPEYSDEAIVSELQSCQLAYTKLDDNQMVEEAAQRLASGEILGWFRGRAEWGPRALGNRSILAHPGLTHMKDALNARIKHREAFRPFAPAVLAEMQDEVFVGSSPSPFMLHVHKIQKNWRERLCAVNHVDDTGRLQTVTRESNLLFHKLISAFYDKTGIPVLLNTSFNENEPIVCAPSEAVDCFLRTQMDSLVIGSYLCSKQDLPGKQVAADK